MMTLSCGPSFVCRARTRRDLEPIFDTLGANGKGKRPAKHCGKIQNQVMRKLLLVLAVASISCGGPSTSTSAQVNPEIARLKARADRITITRDDWGIAHVHGKTDADAVFGAVYAQAEDDFNRVETNFINSQGRLAEAEGEREIYRDLRMKLFIDPAEMKAIYAKAPAAMKALMDGWADGLNYYLATHPNVIPRVIKHFEPWMALTFSEGSIGGDIERVDLTQLQNFYGGGPTQTASTEGLVYPEEPTGSNGIALGPSVTASGKAMLYINPHTSFYFRSELQMTSDEGLNAYGASTWGQFFIYQGFNEKAGWMHTSSSVDNIDEFLETVTKKGDGYVYKYGNEERPVTMKKITVPYKTETGMATKEFTVYRTHHGPVVRKVDGKWVSVKLMEEPLKALMQSYTRTKAKNLREYLEVMKLHTNSSNNTLFADAEGNFGYFHSNFIPRRNDRFDYTKPVDGSDPATDWGAPLSFEESPNVVNPTSGWAYNSNNYPFSAAGANSPKRKDFPKYVDSGSENPRGVHAMRLLDGKKGFTLDSLIAAGFDSYQPEFANQLPVLLKNYDALQSNPLKAKLAEPIKVLRGWDYRWGVDSVANSLAIFYGDDLYAKSTPAAGKAGVSVYEFMAKRAKPQQRIDSLVAAVDKLTADFGKWNTPWGDINRFQRIKNTIVPEFDDSEPSIPVMFASARYGSLASFGARAYKNTKKWYGSSGNSFVAGVEFGDKVRARAVTAGGENGQVGAKHFNDQAERYTTGKLREVYFYPEQLQGHTEKTYHPGEQR
jgi:acyl-homoserine-lactone acylase